ncbi:MAG: HD domain-containing protein [Clostridiales bacterium]|nr:HD domain-containing protein [Clostridiales bacterium]
MLIKRDILFHHLSAPVLDTGLLNQLKEFKQHGKCTCYDHSIAVAKTALFLSMILPFRFKQKQLVKGALLHDYFLYDWHKVKLEKLHGFHHPKIAAENAHRDFKITKIEENIIRRHMFPLTPIPPKYRESVLVTISDKYCATKEVFVALGHKIRGLHPATHIANTVAFLLAFLPWR